MDESISQITKRQINKQELPLISIIVPVYNVGLYLENCIISIINQTYTNLEIILINDGSTDNSGKICDEYVGKDSRIIVIHKKNAGVSEARNIGIQMAKGDYIAFIDGDDYIHPQMIETLHYHLAKEPTCDFAMINFQTTYNNPPINYEIIQPDKLSTKHLSQNELFGGLFSVNTPIQNILLFYAVHCKLYRKQIIKDTIFQDFVLSQDSEYNSRLYLKCKKAIYVDKPLYFYVQRNSSAIHQKYNINHVNRIKVYHTCYNNIPNDMPIIKSWALERLYKFMINMRYLIRNTDNEIKNYTNRLIRDIREETSIYLKKDSTLSFPRKYGLLIFTYFPFIYELFILLNEYKAKFRNND